MPCSDMSSNVREALPGAADRVKVRREGGLARLDVPLLHMALSVSRCLLPWCGGTAEPPSTGAAQALPTSPAALASAHATLCSMRCAQDAASNVGEAAQKDATNAKDRAVDAGASARDAAAVRRDEATVTVLGSWAAGWLGRGALATVLLAAAPVELPGEECVL